MKHKSRSTVASPWPSATQREILAEFRKCPDNPTSPKRLRKILYHHLHEHKGLFVIFMFDRGREEYDLPRIFGIKYDLSRLRKK